jgi:hypothetical protein
MSEERMPKRLAAVAFAAAFFMVTSADAQQTRSALSAQNNSQIKANGIGAITGGVLNGVLGNIINSIGALPDTNVWTGVNTFPNSGSVWNGSPIGTTYGGMYGAGSGSIAIGNGSGALPLFVTLGTGVSSAIQASVTGSGGIVLSTSPTLTTPNLGTPSALVLTNATGLPPAGGGLYGATQYAIPYGGGPSSLPSFLGPINNTVPAWNNSGVLGTIGYATANTASALVQRDANGSVLVSNAGIAGTDALTITPVNNPILTYTSLSISGTTNNSTNREYLVTLDYSANKGTGQSFPSGHADKATLFIGVSCYTGCISSWAENPISNLYGPLSSDFHNQTGDEIDFNNSSGSDFGTYGGYYNPASTGNGCPGSATGGGAWSCYSQALTLIGGGSNKGDAALTIQGTLSGGGNSWNRGVVVNSAIQHAYEDITNSTVSLYIYGNHTNIIDASTAGTGCTDLLAGPASIFAVTCNGEVTSSTFNYQLGGDTNGALVLGPSTGGSGSKASYIDFHSGAASYDARIQANAANQLSFFIDGASTITALVLTHTDVLMPTLPTSAGAGGLYLCVDTSGDIYKKASCP